MFTRLVLVAGLVFITSPVMSQDKAPQTGLRLPGMQAGGQMLLPTQWSLKPAGKQLALGDFPRHDRHASPRKVCSDLACGLRGSRDRHCGLDRIPSSISASLPETFVGLRFNSTGSELFASGAEKETVHRFDFKGGYLSNHRELQIVPIKERQVPGGLTLSSDDKTLFVACPWGNTVCIWPLNNPDNRKFIKFEAESYRTLPARRRGQKIVCKHVGQVVDCRGEPGDYGCRCQLADAIASHRVIANQRSKDAVRGMR